MNFTSKEKKNLLKKFPLFASHATRAHNHELASLPQTSHRVVSLVFSNALVARKQQQINQHIVYNLVHEDLFLRLISG